MASASQIASSMRAQVERFGLELVKVSWDDASRGWTSSGSLSCWGSNIADVRMATKSNQAVYIIRHSNMGDSLVLRDLKDIYLVVGNAVPSKNKSFHSEPAPDVLRTAKHYQHAGINIRSLYQKTTDTKVSVRYTVVFVREDEEITTSVYNYHTTSPEDPQNILVYSCAQGTSFDQDSVGAQRLFLQQVDESGRVSKSWLQARGSHVKVGQASAHETQASAQVAASQGSAYAVRIGTNPKPRFNTIVLMQLPLQQKRRFKTRGSNVLGNMPVLKSAPAAACAPVLGAGTTSAARMSASSVEMKDWKGVAAGNTPLTRHPKTHPTVTIITFYAVKGGVPTEADVQAALDELKQNYGDHLVERETLKGDSINDEPMTPATVSAKLFDYSVPPNAYS